MNMYLYSYYGIDKYFMILLYLFNSRPALIKPSEPWRNRSFAKLVSAGANSLVDLGYEGHRTSDRIK